MKLYKKNSLPELASVTLPGSKSISHRTLIAAAICGLPFEKLQGLSDCADTGFLKNALINLKHKEFYFGDGATPMHFFMAFASAKNIRCIITGTDRLMQRPHGDLLHLLAQCGAEIKERKGEILIEKGMCSFGSIIADASKSSQHISAMMLVSPLFSGRKEITLTGKPASFPYIELTADVLRLFGIETIVSEQKIIIEDGQYKAPKTLNIESDWSSAAFFYSLTACEPKIKILLKKLRFNSFQGDSVMAGLYEELGVSSVETEEGVLISNNGKKNPNPVFNLINHPDCAPALLASCAYLGLNASFSGLDNLVLKESDRLQAMKDNLQQMGITIHSKAGLHKLDYKKVFNQSHLEIKTCNDHRIAMSMAVFGLRYCLNMDNGDCVNKSFPDFWRQWGHWFQTDR